jgi:cobalt/nickel transport system permease protein
MHLAEGTLPLNQALTWTAIVLPPLIWSLKGEKGVLDEESSSNSLISGATSLLFAVTLLPLPIPVVGATSHICFTPIFALMLGVRRTIWATFFVLLLQALFFAHGGITTLGVNTLTLGVFGPLAAVGMFKLGNKFGLNTLLMVGVSCAFADIFVYVTDAAVLAIGLSDVVSVKETFVIALLGFAPVQVPLAVLEGVISISIIKLLNKRKPEILPKCLQHDLPPLPNITTPLIVLISVLGLSGCTYEGIDGSVFGDIASQNGQSPTSSLIDLSTGELGLAMTILILFSLGFVAGQNWERVFGVKDEFKG